MKPSRRILGDAIVRSAALAALSAALLPAQAADYCCVCKGQPTGKSIEAPARAVAVGQCSLECGGYTNVTSGKCTAPPPVATPAPAAAPSASGGSGVVLAYKSEDCSDSPIRVAGSTARLEQGVRSFQVESGAPASAWEKPDYAGRHTEFVAGSICVSPGFDIQSIKLQ
jgi:hypothetical protein